MLFSGSYTATASMPGAPSERSRPSAATRDAVSSKDSARSVPATRNAPSPNSTSSAAASSAPAAIGFMVSMRRSTALTTAPPPIGRDQDPPVPGPARDPIGIALDDTDLLEREAEALVQDLAVGGIVPLAVRHRPDEEGHGSVRVDVEVRALAQACAAAATLDVAGDAEPPEAALRLRF